MAKQLVLTANDESVRADPFRLVNNVWNIGELVNGVDFRQRVVYDPTDLTRGARFSWTYGPNPEHTVRAYPEIAAGYDIWGVGGPTGLNAQIGSLRDMDVSFDLEVGGDTTGFNVAFDLWLVSDPGAGRAAITTEVMVWLHSGDFTPAGDVVGRTRAGGHAANVHVADDFSTTDGLDWRYIAIDLDADLLAGSVDLAEALRYLERKGLVSAYDQVIGYELGAEVSSGKGALTINRVAHDFSTYAVTRRGDVIVGDARDELIDGQSGDDRISGKGGDDDLRGGAGHDRLSGGAGDDRLYGVGGDDRLKGGSGKDTLDGGDGVDTLYGGAGADRFVFTTGAKARLAADGDRIVDFSHLERDRIDLRAIDADPLADGDQPFSFIGGGEFWGGRGLLRVAQGPDAILIEADLDGDRAADFTIHLDGAGPAPEWNDFLF